MYMRKREGGGRSEERKKLYYTIRNIDIIQYGKKKFIILNEINFEVHVPPALVSNTYTYLVY